jgi:hypothetical protein
MNANKKKFKLLCEKVKTIPLFLSYDWVSTVCLDKDWDVLLAEKNDSIHGFWVLYHQKKLNQNYVTMPSLTPYMGIWLIYPENQKTTSKLSFEKNTMEMLLKQLPKYDFLVQHFYPTLQNWLPLYWNDFKQTTRYTYIIEPNNETIRYQNLKENIRREIKKAESNLTIHSSIDANILFRLKKASVTKNKEPLAYDEKYLHQIIQYFSTHQKGSLWIASDNKKMIAAMLLAKDNHSYYYLMGAVDPEYKSSGALSLLLWHGIQLANKENLSFNFEGSMLKPIERFFSSFGGNQVAYHRITKTNSIVSKTKELFLGGI